MTEFVRVRVALAMRPNGCWDALGYSDGEDGELSEQVAGIDSSGPTTLYWLVADVPKPPETAEINADVEIDAVDDR